MKTIRSLLNDGWYQRYTRISKLSLRSSIYDITGACNLRCKSCFFFNSEAPLKTKEETSIEKWDAFVEKEKDRGVNLAILVGGEPSLHVDRINSFYTRMRTFCTTNGQRKIPRELFPDMRIGISLWGNEEDEAYLRGASTFAASVENYKGDPRAYFLYIITPLQIGKMEQVIRKIKDAGLKVHAELLSNDENIEGLSWTDVTLREIQTEMDGMLEMFPGTFLSSRYYHRVITTGEMMGRQWGWEECPSVSAPFDTRKSHPRRLYGMIRWGADHNYVYRCCSSDTRNCRDCHDSAAQTAWIIVNKRDHLHTTESLQNWIEVCEMFAALY